MVGKLNNHVGSFFLLVVWLFTVWIRNGSAVSRRDSWFWTSVQIIDLLPQSLSTFVHGLIQFQENDYGMEATVNICASVGLSISTQTKRKKQQNISKSRSPSSCLIMREMLNYVRCMKCTSVNSLSGVTFIDLICSCYWVELSH